MFKSLASSASLACRHARPAQPFASTSSALFSTSACPSAPAPPPTGVARAPRRAAGVKDVQGAKQMADMFDNIDIQAENSGELSVFVGCVGKAERGVGRG